MRLLTPKQIQALKVVEGYSYNAMEVCRALNGIDPKKFQGCYYDFGYVCRGSHRCKHDERGCRFNSNNVDQRLRALQRRGELHSIKIRWFDGRDGGSAANSLQLDNFRFYYRTRKDLARKLHDDIRKHLEEN